MANRKKKQVQMQEILLYDHDDSVNIKCADVDPAYFQVALGDDTPSLSTYDFKDNQTQLSRYQQFSSEVSSVLMDSANDHAYAGTLGGTIVQWNTQQKKMSGKLSGHLSNCFSLVKNARIMVSGSLDTNVKVWDPRMKTCITTFKGHLEEITCLDISPDSMIIGSGSMDGTVKLWDLKANKLLKTIQVSNVGVPKCMQFNPKDLCLAVGSTDKITTIDNTPPSKLKFDDNGKHAFVGYQDCIKVYILENDVGRCQLLDVIPKVGNCYRDVLDLKVNCSDSGHLFLCEQVFGAQGNSNQVLLSQVALQEINFDPKITPKPQAFIPQPSQQQYEQRPILMGPVGGMIRKGHQITHENKQQSSVLAQNGLSLLGHSMAPISQTQELPRSTMRDQQKFLPQQQLSKHSQRPPSSQSIKSFYEQPRFDQPSDLKLEDFLTEVNPSSNMSEQEHNQLINDAMKDHTKVVMIMRQRNEMLEGILRHWAKKDITVSLDHILKIKEQNLFVDALSCTLSEQPKIFESFNYDQADNLLKRCKDLMETDKFRVHLQTLSIVIRHLLNTFNFKILQTLRQQSSTWEQSLNEQQENIVQKCKDMVDKFQAILSSNGLKKLLRHHTKHPGKSIKSADGEAICMSLKQGIEDLLEETGPLINTTAKQSWV